MPREYQYLTPEERAHFVEHGWLRVENAINPKYVQEWTENMWTRLGYDPEDKSTWKETYVKLPRHREVPVDELCPKAYQKMVEIVGGPEVIDPVRERYHGDQLIINFGSEYWKTHEVHPTESKGWHTDNDWYRQFLTSSGNALTIIHCFTDGESGFLRKHGSVWLWVSNTACSCLSYSLPLPVLLMFSVMSCTDLFL